MTKFVTSLSYVKCLCVKSSEGALRGEIRIVATETRIKTIRNKLTCIIMNSIRVQKLVCSLFVNEKIRLYVASIVLPRNLITHTPKFLIFLLQIWKYLYKLILSAILTDVNISFVKVLIDWFRKSLLNINIKFRWTWNKGLPAWLKMFYFRMLEWGFVFNIYILTFCSYMQHLRSRTGLLSEG